MGLWIDLFCGGGGASEGIVEAIERPVDLAINHSPVAIAMHKANHPETKHYREDVWEVDPREACGSQEVDGLWASPDCTHFSRAKGAQPRSKGIRSLAHVVIRWAKAVRPRAIFMENVEEFEDWGPLNEDGSPDKSRKGEEFRAWLAALVAWGYSVEFRTLVAADYGTPTTRKRLFLVARRGGASIVWPEPTHGRGRALPWRTAASIIDWSIPCPSIFDRKRPLAEPTLRRIAAGLRRYVIDAAQPFIVPVTHTKSGDRVHSIHDPLRTVTTAKGGELVLVAPSLIQTGYGEREGQAPRSLDLHKPLGTVVSGGKHALVTGFLTKHYGKGVFKAPLDEPLGTVTAREHFTASQVTLAPVEASFLTKFYGTAVAGAQMDLPLPTVTSGGGHLAEVRAFLIKYYGADGGPGASQQSLFGPLHTVTARARFGLVTIRGEEYAIADIGMRMLAPRELFNAQGFRHDYIIDLEHNGRPLTKAQQIEMAGNSVCRQKARAVVSANIREGRAAA